MNKLVHWGFSVLRLSKILMYAICYDYVKPKYDENAKLCYVNKDSFNVYMKTVDIQNDIADDVGTRFDTSNYELECNSTDIPLPKEKN